MKKSLAYPLPVIFISIIAIIYLISCQENQTPINNNQSIIKPDSNKIESIVFGAYVGDFHEPWTIAFNVDNNGAYVDTTDTYLHRRDSTFDFKKYPLDKKNTKRAQTILNRIPKYLIDKSKEQIDCTQCYDLGGTYLEIRTQTDTIRYHTNCRAEHCSDTLKKILSEIDSVMHQIIKSANLKWH